MIRSTLFLTAAGAAIVTMAASALTGSASADYTVTCESSNDRREKCRLHDYGYVSLDDRLSDAPCHKGRDWGYTHAYIWVAHGCRGRFRVESRHHSSWDDDDDDFDGGDVAAAAAIAGITTAVAMSANNNRSQQAQTYSAPPPQPAYAPPPPASSGVVGSAATGMPASADPSVPSYVVGTFTGRTVDGMTPVTVTIQPDGRLTASINGTSIYGYTNNGHVYVGDHIFRTEQAGDGFDLIEEANPQNRVHYSRTG